MVCLHQPHAPTVMTARGHALKTYGKPGDLCAGGCGTVLRRSNAWDTCAQCMPKRSAALRPRDYGERDDTPCDQAPGFMEPAALPTGEEIDMAAQERRKVGATKAKILAHIDVCYPDTVGCGEISKKLGIATSTATSHLQQLFEAGKLARVEMPSGGFQYRSRIRPGENVGGLHPADPPAPDTSQAPAPLPEGEPAADPAAVGPISPPPTAPPPPVGSEIFGAVAQMGEGMDEGALAIDACLRVLRPLVFGTRQNVMDYIRRELQL